MYAVSILPVPL